MSGFERPAPAVPSPGDATGAGTPHVYSNRIARDMLPGVIKPLVWSVNTSIVDAAWIRLLEEVVGPLGLQPSDLTRSFGYRAYFDMTTFGAIFEGLGMPQDSLERMLGLQDGPRERRMGMSRATLRHLPRMLAIARGTLSRGRWTRAELEQIRHRYDELAAVDLATLDEPALLRRADDVAALARRAAYANIVVPMTLLAYERTLWLQLRSAGLGPGDVDPVAGRADRAAWDPNASLDRLRVVADRLPSRARQELVSRGRAALEQDPLLAPLRDELDAFVARFGHLSGSNNDFSRPSWREDGDSVVGLVLDHPVRARQSNPVAPAAVEARLPRYSRPAFRLLWRRTGAFHVYRNAVGATWSRTYGLLRSTFLALGERLVARGVLDQPDDVFFLYLDEVRRLVAGQTIARDPDQPGQATVGDGSSPTEAAALVSRRRREVAEAVDLVVPEVVYGDAFVPRARVDEAPVRLEGVPASGGVARGTARIVRDMTDFTRVAPGDIIVIPFSDVAWNPLFARASGVVAEEGAGILSHAAIVSREYGIPCVVNVPDACSVLQDGTAVIVDGTAGLVVVEGPGGAS